MFLNDVMSSAMDDRFGSLLLAAVPFVRVTGLLLAMTGGHEVGPQLPLHCSQRFATWLMSYREIHAMLCCAMPLPIPFKQSRRLRLEQLSVHTYGS